MLLILLSAQLLHLSVLCCNDTNKEEGVSDFFIFANFLLRTAFDYEAEWSIDFWLLRFIERSGFVLFLVIDFEHK